MAKKMQPSDAAFQPIRDTAAGLERVDPAQVQEALGAERLAEGLEEALAPVTLFAVREELVQRLQSSGGRPALAGVTRRAKIPLNDEEWFKLEELAAAISSPGFAPSAGQVASVLLTLSIHSVVSHANSGKSSSGLVRELLQQMAAGSTQGPTSPCD